MKDRSESKGGITLAKSAGFCFGVRRAINTVTKLLESSEKVVTLGPIINNKALLKELRDKGVKIIYNLEDVPKDCALVIRAHGVAKSVLEEVKKKKLRCFDATCHFVLKIHKIVENIKKDDIILIGGDINHPEVKGIIGHCLASCYVFKNEKEILKILHLNEQSPKGSAWQPQGFVNAKLYVVAQTTFSLPIWNSCLEIINICCPDAVIFDTICSATIKRQLEAEQIAKNSDIMLVIGDDSSSNTAKISEICKKHCETHLIENARDLPLIKIKRGMNIGVMAGASTPANIIEEVLCTMTQELENQEEFIEEMDFATMLEESLKNLSSDDRVRGVVVGIAPNEVYVDVGRKQAGFIPLSELSAAPISRAEDVVSIGDELDLLIMKTNDQEGTIMLSKKRLEASKGWDKIIAAGETGEVLTGTVTELVKGGIITVAHGLRIFIPASQATLYKSDPLEDLLKKQISFKIIEANKAKRKAVGSVRAVLKDKQKIEAEDFWQKAQIGTAYTGVVKSLTNYGAFVNIGSVDGMIHISELSWGRVRHPSEIVNIGDTVEVYIKDLDSDKKKIALGYKRTEDDPWQKLKNEYKDGDIIDVSISNFTEYGAFATVVPGIDGLIHISQISDKRIERPQSVLKIGETVKVKIIGINFEKKRVSLSMIEVEGNNTNTEEKI